MSKNIFKRGFTLVEVLISISILTLTSLVIYQTYISNVKNLKWMTNLTYANTILNSYMESIKAMPFYSLYETESEIPLHFFANEKMKLKIKKIYEDLFKVELELEFYTPEKTKRVLRLETYRYKNGI